MKVTAVSVETLELAYEEPFVIASSALTAGPCDLVRVETDEGLTGYGEACPAYEFTGDTLWTVEDVIGEYLAPATIGRDPFRIEEIVHIWERELWTVGNQAARAALEMALWDLQGKALGRPLVDLVGGRTRDGLPEVIAWGWDEPAALSAKTRASLSTPIRAGTTWPRRCAPSSGSSRTASSSWSSRCAWTISRPRAACVSASTCPLPSTSRCASRATLSPRSRPARPISSWSSS
jgi:hypothetical protein